MLIQQTCFLVYNKHVLFIYSNSEDKQGQTGSLTNDIRYEILIRQAAKRSLCKILSNTILLYDIQNNRDINVSYRDTVGRMQ